MKQLTDLSIFQPTIAPITIFRVNITSPTLNSKCGGLNFLIKCSGTSSSNGSLFLGDVESK